LLIDVRSVNLTGNEVEVGDAGSLVGLARRLDRPILHEERGDAHLYLVEGEVTTYCYRARNGTGVGDERGSAGEPLASSAAEDGGGAERDAPTGAMRQGDRE